ncbi:MAG: spondin domain-containing protein [Schleiferiaceae bacterium]|jgi:hypothetical protein|nr:spondin domain-containing protein [Schleiferiaceae bacterium]
MKISKTLMITTMAGLSLIACKKDKDNGGGGGGTQPSTQNFKVTIENISQDKKFFASGHFNTPVGDASPGGAAPGKSYAFDFNAPEGAKLSFATMFVMSNDLFYGPDGMGIELYNNGNPVTGDVTNQLDLWDAGTEVNEMPGTGPNQPLNQSGPNTGPDENGTVRTIMDVNDGYTYPTLNTAIKAMLTYNGDGNFTMTIENLNSNPSPIAPGVWVVHNADNPLFEENASDMMQGLEALAEDGDPSMLADYLHMNTGIASPLAPGVWAVHSAGYPLFQDGMEDFGEGLEALAEDGDPSGLIANVMNKAEVKSSGVFNTPVGAGGPGPLMPGNSYEFEFTASQGDLLSFATMFVQSNDIFYGPDDAGMPLWNGNNVVLGDITSSIDFWDAGTEVNEYPGTGVNQPIRQAGPNTGTTENGNVRIVDDGYTYLSTDETIRVTISLN